MFLDFRDLNNKISSIVSSGTVNGIREIGGTVTRIINSALSCQPKAINSYNKVAQGLIIDGAYQDITPEHLKSVASSVIMTAEQSAIEDLRLLDAGISRFANEAVTTPLTGDHLTSHGSIQALCDGFMVCNNELYVNPAIWQQLRNRARTICMETPAHDAFFPIGITPLGDHEPSSTGKKPYGVLFLYSGMALLVEGTQYSTPVVDGVMRIDQIAQPGPTIDFGLSMTSNLKIGVRTVDRHTFFIITDNNGNELNEDEWIKVEWNAVTSRQVKWRSNNFISQYDLELGQITGDLRKAVGPVTSPVADAMRDVVCYSDLADIPSLLHAAL